MRTLVLDCSTEACSVALFDDARLIDGRFEMLGRGHAERLVPMIAELPGRGRAECVIAGLGPGSFTGVRVAIAAARALGLAWSSHVAGYPTMALVAAMALAGRKDDAIAVVMAGGHGEWFVEGLDAEAVSTRSLASLTPDAAVATTHEALVAGTRAEDLVNARGWGAALPLHPDARAFGLLPTHAVSARIDPIYGRGPDARLPGAG